ncbi:MAG: hypothetical protein QM697_04105 [Lachnospiraceae bacterium]
MVVISKSLRQLLRTPVRSLLFLLLITLAAALLSLGAGLFMMSEQNIKRLEDVFITIGTVQQIPDETTQTELWSAEKKELVSTGTVNKYNKIIPVDTLHFDDANYIYAPTRMPYYGAYHPDFTYRDDFYINLIAQTRDRFPILEVTPIKDCVPSEPVELKLVRELYGLNGTAGRSVQDWETILYCDHYNPNPPTLHKDTTYIMALEWGISHIQWKKTHTGADRLVGEYFPRSCDSNYVLSSQYTQDGQLIPDVLPMQTRWDIVTDGFYETPQGKRWLQLAKAMEMAEHTIPVIPTESTQLLMSFYNGNATIQEGRDISSEEYQNGQQVCLISQEFAKINGYKIGNRLPLPLYYADYRDSASRDFPPDSLPLGNPNHLLNAQGQCYDIFEEKSYLVVGIYNEINKASRSSGYDMAGYGVVIPAASIKNSDANNILDYGPMMGYNTVFQISNGTIDKFMKEWEKQGISGLEITFYDKGYTQLKEGLDQIKQIALAMFITGTLITILILLFFSNLFIGKQIKRTAIERSLGMGKLLCTTSLLSGILIIVLLGSILGNTIGYSLSQSTMEQLSGQSQEPIFSTEYSNWIDSGNSATEVQITTTPHGIATNIITGALVVALALFIALININSNLKSEPLKLLSKQNL